MTVYRRHLSLFGNEPAPIFIQQRGIPLEQAQCHLIKLLGKALRLRRIRRGIHLFPDSAHKLNILFRARIGASQIRQLGQNRQFLPGIFLTRENRRNAAVLQFSRLQVPAAG